MHDLYYKGRIHTRKNHVTTGYNTKRIVKLGTEKNPLTLVVASEERKLEVATLVANNKLFAEITVDNSLKSDEDENINELNTILNKPTTTTFEKTPNRNEPCSCGSGKKYKKCCA
ncbi:PBPRA1643 family SWIM/SEC-C metal-binding motif protein [Colwellia sp. UCD-KL20]|uniref:PBPRA1643 family SWIM/SEC-C metal-binding motif protein n=1 Tax=Colwellia sp. UCD-KL20 TaxID=1917165 RepID=UPI0009702DF0|nr:PBPRA1643 family SWIM/SEC-C metal-binding motif protein [Colwellia sp. UCD-KL20]